MIYTYLTRVYKTKILYISYLFISRDSITVIITLYTNNIHDIVFITRPAYIMDNQEDF